jgi:DNA-binding CsgD family transcriptional regulator
VTGDRTYRAHLEAALELEVVDDARTSAWDWSPTNAAAACALHALDVNEIRLRFGALLACGGQSGNADLEQYGAYGLAQAELAAGDPRRAEELSDIVDELARETGVLHLPGSRLRAEIDAHVGRTAEARAGLAGVISESEAIGERRYTWQARAALGALELAEGNVAVAAKELRAARALAEELGMQDPVLLASLVDEVDAAAAANLFDQAEEALGSAQGLASQPDWGAAVLLRASAVLAARRGRLDEAESTLARSLSEASTLPLQRARILLALGSVQRRRRQRATARQTLEAALASFEELGARPWAGRARAELARIGGRPRASAELTPSEGRIAELVAGGKTNKEVAAALVLAERTVESALTKIYDKLDVRSRTELARKFAAPG